MSNQASRSRESWTQEEEYFLLFKHRQGLTHEAIASKLGRSNLACRLKLHKILRELRRQARRRAQQLAQQQPQQSAQPQGPPHSGWTPINAQAAPTAAPAGNTQPSQAQHAAPALPAAQAPQPAQTTPVFAAAGAAPRRSPLQIRAIMSIDNLLN